MKYKSLYQTISILTMFLLVAGNASAIGISGNTGIGIKASTSKSSLTASTSVRINDDEVDDKDDTQDGDDDKTEKISSTSPDKDDREDENENDDKDFGEEHRSVVAKIVLNLLKIAERDNQIGGDIKIVAQEQASTSIKVKKDMDEVSGESKVKVFLFGSDYKNLGEIRSSIETTRNHITRLKRAEQKTTDIGVKADLIAQINILEEEASTTEAFVNKNESKFALFGWFVKLFSK